MSTSLNILDLEECLIDCKLPKNLKTWADDEESIDSNLSQIFLHMIKGKFLEALSKPSCQDILKLAVNSFDSKDNEYKQSGSVIELVVGVSCLQLFVQLNWSGPAIKDELTINKIKQLCSHSEEKMKEQLNVDGEVAYDKILHPSLLALSRCLLSQNYSEEMPKTWLIWQLRSVYVHQCLMEEKCNSLKEEVMRCINTLLSKEEDISCQYRVCWQLEAAYQARCYYEYKLCKKLLEMAEKCCNLHVQFTGITGKRTLHQKKDLAQLVVTVKRQNGLQENTIPRDVERPLHLPKNLPLNDDTVMDRLEFTGESASDDVTAELNWVEQALILSLCDQNRHVKHSDVQMTEEETMAYLRCVLENSTDWSVQYKALLTRSITEKASGRRLERSFTQLEELAGLASDSGEPDVTVRLKGVYTAIVPPVYQVQRSLGELHMDIGAYASAVEVFERLELWIPLITCCQRAGRLGKAELLIRERLKVEETPNLYCSLADVTDEPEYYTKAWELSHKKSSRAMRGLGMHHMRATNFDSAIDCFEKTLAINSLQLGCWFSCGCACLSLSRYEQAAKCFRRCIMLDEDNYEAWNNLSAAYARAGQKERAFSVLQDAIKCSYDNWRVWENYSLIGADCGHFVEVIQAGHRILELKGKWADEDVLKLLTSAVIENIPDNNDRPSSLLKSKLLELFGHVTSAVTNNGTVWQLYGKLLISGEDNSSETVERGIQCLQKGYRSEMNIASWEKDLKKCVSTTDSLLELVEAYKSSGNSKFLPTARLQLKSHIARLRQSYTDPISKQLSCDVEELVFKLEDTLSHVQKLIESRVS